MNIITDNEKLTLIQFKQNLSDLQLDNDPLLKDPHLKRWLRARNMNLTRAEQMLRNNLAWREGNNIKNILEKHVPESLQVEFPFHIVGNDKVNNVLVYIPYGQMNLKKGIREHGLDEAKVMARYYMEKVFQAVIAKSDENSLKRMSVIIDFENLSYTQLASVDVLDLIMYTLRIGEQNYPELLGIGFMVNAPSLFSYLWSMTKPLLDRKTVENVVIIGCDNQQIQETLEKYIENNFIPEKYGGTLKL